MKILVYADPHWSQYSSILRSRGVKYSKRLEGLINSLNWIEDLAKQHSCESICCLGDFFDQPTLNGEEITALNDIEWSKDISHVMIVGNHELSINTLEYSSAHLFNLIPRTTVIDKPQQFFVGETEVCFLPYILERDRKSFVEYFGTSNGKRIVFSHNDLEGVQMGKFISPEGFSIEEIKENCNLFFNGHLHNESIIDNIIINVGNITGQNFSEDALKYSHKAYIVDTETLEYISFLNPYAFNFMKLDASCNSLYNFKTLNNVISCTNVSVDQVDSLVQTFNNEQCVLEYRIVVTRLQSDNSSHEIVNNAIDHIEQFKQYVFDNVGSSDVIIAELQML